MKKVLLSFAVLGLLSATACKKEEAKVEELATEVAGEVKEGAEAVVEEVAGALPTFSDPEAQEYVKTYDAFLKEYKEAISSKDATKLPALETKATELQTKAVEISKKLTSNPEDLKKFTEYSAKAFQDLQAALTAQ